MSASVPSNSRLSLTTLPIEIQCAIFRLLDPIGLIAISQTDSRLRKLIQPTKIHFAERLLALECLVEEGGVTPIFSPKTNKFDPHWTSPEWNSMRWACTTCMRLRPSTEFDNHSLMKLRYRKPIPGSPAAKLYTSWEPWRARRAQKGRRQTLEASPEEKKLRRRHEIAMTHNFRQPKWYQDPGERLASFQESGLEMFADMTLPEFIKLEPEEEKFLFDQEVCLIELVRAGFKRGLRTCNECRYQRGDFKPKPTGEGGTEKVPIVTSRRIEAANVLDRFLPGISDLFKTRPPFDTPVLTIYRHGTRYRLWTLYMIRCPGCAQWKESRKFMFGSFWGHWQPHPASAQSIWHESGGFRNWDWTRVSESMIDNLLCNNCHVAERGRDAFRDEFFRFLTWIVEVLQFNMESPLSYGWGFLHGASNYCHKTFKKQVRHFLEMPYRRTRFRRGNNGYTYDDVALFRLYFNQWLELRERLIQEGKAEWIREDTWFGTWIHAYDEIEANWRWFKGIQLEVETRNEALVDWVLEFSNQPG